MQEICLYSMGICSAYIAVRLQQDGKEPICLKQDTRREDEDTYRFGDEVQERFGLNVVEASYGEDLWDKWRRDHIIPARTLSQCSREFKIEPSQEWLEDWAYEHRNGDTEDIVGRVAYGYELGEVDRAERTLRRWNNRRLSVWFPLIEWGVTKEQCFGFFHEVGIAPPRMYRHFQHANCLPCKNFREKDWRALQFHYPEKFKEAVEFEQEMQEFNARWMQDGPLLIELKPLAQKPSRKGRHKLAGDTPAFSFDMGCDRCAMD